MARTRDALGECVDVAYRDTDDSRYMDIRDTYIRNVSPRHPRFGNSLRPSAIFLERSFDPRKDCIEFCIPLPANVSPSRWTDDDVPARSESNPCGHRRLMG